MRQTYIDVNRVVQTKMMQNSQWKKFDTFLQKKTVEDT